MISVSNKFSLLAAVVSALLLAGCASGGGSSKTGVTPSASSSCSKTSCSEDFNNATTDSFFTAAYQSVPGNSRQPMYLKTGGAPTIANGVLTLAGARFAVGALGDTGTNSSSTPGGYFDVVGKTCTFILNAKAPGSGTGKFQVYVDNNTTGQNNSIHGASSKAVEVAADTIVAGNNNYTWKIDAGKWPAGTGSFLQIRTDSNATVQIDSFRFNCV
jgi:hypothetical protein